MPYSKLFAEWMKYAEDDLKFAKHGTKIDVPDYKNSCYHCQQCAEKALKAFIIFNNQAHKYIHDLEKLCLDCQAFEPEFKNIYKQCAILSEYNSVARYPSNYTFIEAEMLYAIELAEEILNFVKEKTK